MNTPRQKCLQHHGESRLNRAAQMNPLPKPGTVSLESLNRHASSSVHTLTTESPPLENSSLPSSDRKSPRTLSSCARMESTNSYVSNDQACEKSITPNTIANLACFLPKYRLPEAPRRQTPRPMPVLGLIWLPGLDGRWRTHDASKSEGSPGPGHPGHHSATWPRLCTAATPALKDLLAQLLYQT